MEVSYTNLVGPRGEKFQLIEPFWSFPSFHIQVGSSHVISKGTMYLWRCNKGGSMDTMHLGGMQIREALL